MLVLQMMQEGMHLGEDEAQKQKIKTNWENYIKSMLRGEPMQISESHSNMIQKLPVYSHFLGTVAKIEMNYQ